MSNEIYWLNADSRKFLERDYLLPGESPEERMKQISDRAEEILGVSGFSNKFLNYLHRGFYSLSSPIWSNFGRERGLPISCFGSYIGDSISSIAGDKYAEVAMMTKHGGGTSGYFGDIRGRGAPISDGGSSTGAVHFMELYETLMKVVSQGSVRRGSFAAYLPVDHPDIEEFLKIQGDGHPIQNLSIGVTITDEWMKSMNDGDKAKRSIWGKIVKKRFESGYPYLFFTDTANNAAPQVYKDKGLKIRASNLCTEIMLSTSEDESFVCDLMSINAERWDEIKETDAVETAIWFLDATMTEFIDKTEHIPHMAAPRKFAMNQRALGLGILGWHTYLQRNMIPLESIEAQARNVEIWKTIRERADKATADLAQKYGEPELLKGYGRRNATTLAVAPTVSSSTILGQVSQGIEPVNSNYFVKDLAKGKFTYKNPVLVDLLEEKGANKTSVWKDILLHGGSVQHLTDLLSDNERAVFKTFGEISQKEIIIQAAQRQRYIDQGQSLNLMINPNTKGKVVSELLIYAHSIGIKSIYYQRGTNPAQTLARNIVSCQTCEA